MGPCTCAGGGRLLARNCLGSTTSTVCDEKYITEAVRGQALGFVKLIMASTWRRATERRRHRALGQPESHERLPVILLLLMNWNCAHERVHRGACSAAAWAVPLS